ncbi:bifunctional RNA-binding domain superfamily/RNA recognition motif domain/Nucleotide-binding alpha-beta plait domain superfamily [Babesia duncani]|uniref:Bifunctional RNA-binding domain superfamily/RNA recognition motif domain/Nucleotide-binding alpha-beta plait domain superfamily n=1 Tax=Babesia duncani TaxID=323732 RepID=A0AAD9PJ69_9APIC|nr:bifunctional RNA-binding domain superfamily/RNA recognition motif domain/Nucleotide-binding alpha-beta plait domain superfamily [Babesia duncani]
MLLQYTFSNLIYVRNISPDVTEQTIRDFFKECDEIVSIDFKRFEHSSRRYCIIEFKTSAGITRASLLNGSLMQGCLLEISVTDPTINQDKQKDLESRQYGYRIGNSDVEDDSHSRTIKVSNLPPSFDRIDVYTLFGNIGNIVSCTIETSDGIRFALVDFSSAFDANEALRLNGTTVSDHCLKIAKVVARQLDMPMPMHAMNDNNPTGVNEPVRSAVMNEKLAKVLEMRERIYRKISTRTQGNNGNSDVGSNTWWSRRSESKNRMRHRRSIVVARDIHDTDMHHDQDTRIRDGTVLTITNRAAGPEPADAHQAVGGPLATIGVPKPIAQVEPEGDVNYTKIPTLLQRPHGYFGNARFTHVIFSNLVINLACTALGHFSSKCLVMGD